MSHTEFSESGRNGRLSNRARRELAAIARANKRVVNEYLNREREALSPDESFRSEDVEVATLQDFRDRMDYQIDRYVELDMRRELTPPYRGFGKRHRNEIWARRYKLKDEKIEAALNSF